MTTINDYIQKPKEKFKPKYNANGIRIETAEEIKNWEEI